LAKPVCKSEYFVRLKFKLINNTQNYGWLGTGEGLTSPCVVTWRPGFPWKSDQSNSAVPNEAESKGEGEESPAGGVFRRDNIIFM